MTSLSTYDFSTLYTTLPHNLIKGKLTNLIEWTFKGEGSPYIAYNERQAFFTSEDTKRYKLWSCQNVCKALIYLLDNIYIRFGTKLYRQIVGIPMGTNCAPLVADLFLFCYERDFMTSLSDVKQAEIIEAFKSTSRYLDDLLNIDNPYFEGMVNRIYPPELQLNKANTSDTEAPCLNLHLSISNRFISSKIYDKRDDLFWYSKFSIFGWWRSPFYLLRCLQGHWWGFFSRNYVVWPTFLLMNVFIALKGSHFWVLFDFTAAGVVPCGGRKTSPRTSTIVQFIPFWERAVHSVCRECLS